MGRIFNLLKEAWKNRGKHLAVFLKVNNIIIKKKNCQQPASDLFMILVVTYRDDYFHKFRFIDFSYLSF